MLPVLNGAQQRLGKTMNIRKEAIVFLKRVLEALTKVFVFFKRLVFLLIKLTIILLPLAGILFVSAWQAKLETSYYAPLAGLFEANMIVAYCAGVCTVLIALMISKIGRKKEKELKTQKKQRKKSSRRRKRRRRKKRRRI